MIEHVKLFTVSVFDLSEVVAPWLSGLFAIGAAVAAERAFRLGTEAQTPERWRGEDAYHTGIDFKEEVDERAIRNASGIRAAATQSMATYLAAAAAIEATAASQHGPLALVGGLFGLAFAGGFTMRRVIIARQRIAYDASWFVRMKWSVDRKWVRSTDPQVEDAQFEADHPVEARNLRQQRR